MLCSVDTSVDACCFAWCREAIAAEDNLKFLLVLDEPCKTLAKAHPADIPGLLGPILNCVRMVWSLSRFYNTPERITVRAMRGSVGCEGASWLAKGWSPAGRFVWLL